MDRGSACWGFPLVELSPRSEWQKVGEGSFGNVFRASLLGLPVAVKEASNSKESRLAGIRRDIQYLRRARRGARRRRRRAAALPAQQPR